MKRIGLTGGIASGKSEVARMLGQLGVPIIDADVLARQAVAPGTAAFQAISTRWPGVVRDGVLDRKALGEIVFASRKDREELEAMIHPWVHKEAWRQMDSILASGEERVVYVVPLLFEIGLEEDLDAVILVTAPQEVRVSRVMRRDGISEEAALARIHAQMPEEEKRAKATFVVENDRDLETLSRRVRELWDEISQGRKESHQG